MIRRRWLLATGLLASLVLARTEQARAEDPAPAAAPASAPASSPEVPAWRPPPAGQIGGDDPKPDDSAIPYYNGGFVLVPTLKPKEVPFRLRINHVSQFRYTNSMAVHHTYVTHLGVEREVLRRNDVQLTRDVFYFSGIAFDPRLDYNILIYTSSATLSATAAGFAGFVFNRAFALRAGFFSLPSTRSMTGTYPFFHSTDRSMANNYMRPGFTQGIWANGELFPGFNYIAMIGNSLNTLDIPATKIDFNFAYSASIWYDLRNFGKEWNDYESHDDLAIRVGTAFTFAREDRLSDLSSASPENNATFISDGTLLFETGTLATGVTVSLANFYLWSIDMGLKYHGLAFNAEVYQRWLNHFTADGPLPLDSMYDWGLEASLGYFVLKKRLETYLRTSLVRGPFAKPIEGALGFNWYPFPTRQVWLNAEAIAIHASPYQSVLYVYSSGQSGALFQVQFLLRF